MKLLYLARFSRYKHFCVLQFLQKIRKFFENWDCYSAEIPCGSNISSKSLYLARFRDISIFVFCNFCEKFENSKWPPFWERQNFFENRDGYSTEMPCGSNISPKSLYLARFSRNKHFCVLQFLRKIQNGRHFGRDKIFLKIGMATLQLPCGSKISLTSLYLARFSRYKHFCVLQFLQKIRKFKMAASLGDKNFLKRGEGYFAEIPCGSKILSKSLYLAWFSRYKSFCVFLIWKIRND